MRNLQKRDDDCFYMWSMMNGGGDDNNMWLIMQVVNGDIDFEDYLMLTMQDGGDNSWLVWLAANGDIDSDYLFFLLSGAERRSGLGMGVLALFSLVSVSLAALLSADSLFGLDNKHS